MAQLPDESCLLLLASHVKTEPGAQALTCTAVLGSAVAKCGDQMGRSPVSSKAVSWQRALTIVV